MVILPASFLFSLDNYPGIVSGSDLKRLENRVVEVDFRLQRFKDGSETLLYAWSDFHGVIDIDIDSLAEVIADHDNGEKVFSRMIETIDLDPDLPLSAPHRQWVHNSARFMGIGQDYKYTTILNIEHPSENEFVMYWTMTDIEEGNFREYAGFWYLNKLEPSDAPPRTYIRLYAETVFDNIIPMQMTVMNMFTAGETRDVFRSIYKAARK